jgi:hypothetical protein
MKRLNRVELFKIEKGQKGCCWKTSLILKKRTLLKNFRMLHQTHEHLKNMEIGLTKKMGAVVIR